MSPLTLDLLSAQCAIVGSARPAENILLIVLEKNFTAFWTFYGSTYWAQMNSYVTSHLSLPLRYVSRRKELTVPEMLITTDGLATAEAEVLTTVTAHHFVAPFSFADGYSTFWT